jgi:hypothetical protein
MLVPLMIARIQMESIRVRPREAMRIPCGFSIRIRHAKLPHKRPPVRLAPFNYYSLTRACSSVATGDALETNDSEESDATKIREATNSREFRRETSPDCDGESVFFETLRFRDRQTDRVFRCIFLPDQN